MPKVAYLTIDDAPSPDFLNKVDFLDAHHIPAVWFCQGNYMEQRPDFIVEAIRRGHVIGNHTYSHPHCSDLSPDQCFAEIRATDAIIEELYGQAGVPRQHRYFRFPYGDKGDGLNGNVFGQPTTEGRTRRDAIQNYLRRLGYHQPAFRDVTYPRYHQMGLLNDVDWYWTYDTLDWSPFSDHPLHGVDSLDKVLERTQEDVPDGWRGLRSSPSAEIILIHDHRPIPVVFGPLVERFVEMGLQFALPA